MRDYSNDIERIIDKGFAPLPVDDAAAAKAIEAVLRNGGRARGERKIVPLKRIESRAIYALAATLVLSTGIGYLVSHRPPSIAARIVEGTPHGEGGATVVSAVNSTGTDSALLRSAGDEFATGKSSQLLLAIGIRTRTVLFERSNLRVERTDSLHTSISYRLYRHRFRLVYPARHPFLGIGGFDLRRVGGGLPWIGPPARCKGRRYHT